MKPRARILLVDDNAGILDVACKLLGGEHEVVGMARNGQEAVTSAMALGPDLVVLDIMMPEMDGFHAAQELRRLGSQVKVIFLTLQWDEGYLAAATQSGGPAYVLKSRMHADLLPTVERALTAEVSVAPLTA